MDRTGPVCFLSGNFSGCFAVGEKAPRDIRLNLRTAEFVTCGPKPATPPGEAGFSYIWGGGTFWVAGFAGLRSVRHSGHRADQKR
jgi:hypothetical protein